jgi:hypothetical protein
MTRLVACFVAMTTFLIAFLMFTKTLHIDNALPSAYSTVSLTGSGTFETQRMSANNDVIRCSSLSQKPSLKYVTGDGIGNQMFAFASALGISVSVGRRIAASTNLVGSVDTGSWCVCIPILSPLRMAFQPLSDWPTCNDDDENATTPVNAGRWGK